MKAGFNVPTIIKIMHCKVTKPIVSTEDKSSSPESFRLYIAEEGLNICSSIRIAKQTAIRAKLNSNGRGVFIAMHSTGISFSDEVREMDILSLFPIVLKFIYILFSIAG